MSIGSKISDSWRFWKGTAAAVLFAVSFMLLFSGKILPAFEVQASVVQNNKIIYFTDDSGKYLEKVKNDWYLRDWDQETLTGVQYLAVPKSEDFITGYYMFDTKGKLVQKMAVYYFKEQTIGKAVFNGYHCTNSRGRFFTYPLELVYLKNLTCSGKTFHGIFYMGEYGRISAPAQVRKVYGQKVGNVSLSSGYLLFWRKRRGIISKKRMDYCKK